ncbi:succinate-semialdehyde dehydrogenase/glutarate-semialdehyde dehydrogenase [Sphingobium fontiphilum]|uniref:Succinate-semialdehyde dehydrogenase/glutarate-semialdehyde dehydrogenase n=1 Tax=Sphingobium fontiphilum TaxID=944425 RepID=A0A7W6DHV3_9SPHN|nr:NAD-dependent succinate-semialdehyde dehydrogenase [Sphingobium fontiphilum]MBB3980877.1 succinate-semialdehyde dehydrogenase/glutarate-semialdehyde dehydrogenase [Sphingobium fontiphilum]
MKSVNPATGEIIATHEELDAAGIEARLSRAAAGFARWRLSGLDERTALLARLADGFAAHRDELAAMATAEMGKTLKSALAEVDKCAALFRHLAQAGPDMLAPSSIPLAAGGRAETRWLPLGPVLAVMPWNFPYWQVARFLAPTILAGNVGLLKHASNVQGAAALIERMVKEAGAPAGVFQNLPIRSGPVGAIIADDRVAAVTLTGSEAAGQAVAEQAGRALKKVVLELGGSDPFIVMPSADLDDAVSKAVTARIQNTGQSCICGKRMIVHEAIHDDFRDRFVAAMAAVKAGDPLDPASDIGPLSSEEQRRTVQAQLWKMKAAGATLTGGEALAGPGAYMTAGVLEDVPVDGDLMAEEIFGPIAMLFRVTDIDDAIRVANAIPFGLGSSVWTRDVAEQERFVRDIAAGMTAINQVMASAPEAPFGGIKRSGHGRELGAAGLHAFMNQKTVLRAD